MIIISKAEEKRGWLAGWLFAGLEYYGCLMIYLLENTECFAASSFIVVVGAISLSLFVRRKMLLSSASNQQQQKQLNIIKVNNQNNGQ